MKKQQELNQKHKEALARIALHEDFVALKSLVEIYKYNLLIKQFSSSKAPIDRTLDHEFYKGQAYALTRLIEDIEKCAKALDNDK